MQRSTRQAPPKLVLQVRSSTPLISSVGRERGSTPFFKFDARCVGYRSHSFPFAGSLLGALTNPFDLCRAEDLHKPINHLDPRASGARGASPVSRNLFCFFDAGSVLGTLELFVRNLYKSLLTRAPASARPYPQSSRDLGSFPVDDNLELIVSLTQDPYCALELGTLRNLYESLLTRAPA